MRNKLIPLFTVWFMGLTVIIIMRGQTSVISSLIYWMILGLIIFTILLFKLRSQVVLLFSFGLFILAALVTTLTFTSIAEKIMRISLLGWIVGFILSLIEYKKLK